MTAVEYPQKSTAENRQGRHYSVFAPLALYKSITCAVKSPGSRVESAKSG